MPAPYNYINPQADVGTAFDAYRAARADRAEVQQTQRSDALRKYLPQAMQGDQAAMQQVTEIDPETGFKLQQSLKAQSAEELKQRIQQIDVLGPLLQGVRDEPGLQAALARAQSLGLDPKVLSNVTLQEIPTFLALSPTVKANAMAELDRKVKEANIRQSDAAANASNANAAYIRGGKMNGPGGGVPGAPAKLTEGQAKDLSYYQRGVAANAKLTPERVGGLTSGWDSTVREIPIMGNAWQSDNSRQGMQAARDFIAALLRKDTGAAVTKEEFDFYANVFLPAYGDDKATLEQKAESRKQALESIKAGLGNAEVLARPGVGATPTAPTLSPQAPSVPDWAR